MQPELDQSNAPPVTRQRLTNIGQIGAVLFVGAPSIGIALAASSTGEFIRRATNSLGMRRPAEALYHPSIYLVLMALGLIGIVLLLIGRETYAVPQRKPVPTRSTEWQ